MPTLKLLAIAITYLGMLAESPSYARSINWSGYNWLVRNSNGTSQGPGPNLFSDSTENVDIDSSGNLRMRIRKNSNNKWLASEIRLNESLSYGTYEWQVSSRYDLLPGNVVGGLFTYLDPNIVAAQTSGSIGNGIADTPHEIDIELTQAFGSGNLYHTTHDPDVPSPSFAYFESLNGSFTTHRFTWEPDRIEWGSYHGHVAGNPYPDFPITDQRVGSLGTLARTIYEGPVVPQDLDEIASINFWVRGDDPSNQGPSDGLEQELIIKSFSYTPLAELPLLGDFNQDGSVDAADYSTWRDGLGVNYLAVDYDRWKENYGQISPQSAISIASHVVPEPASSLCMISYLFVWSIAQIDRRL